MNKSNLLALAAVRRKEIKIEGEPVLIREVGTIEFARYGEINRGKTDDKGNVLVQADKVRASAHLISCCVIDSEGKPLFTEEEAMPIAANARTAMPIINAVMELSGFGEDDEKHSDAG